MTKILIVDDSTTMRKIIMRVLKQAGMQVDTFLEASNGVEGLKALAADSDLDLVLSDIDMPQMDGIAFVKAVRRTHKKEVLPIVMISTESESTTLTSALDSGANGHVTKPFTLDRMRAVIGPYLN